MSQRVEIKVALKQNTFPKQRPNWSSKLKSFDEFDSFSRRIFFTSNITFLNTINLKNLQRLTLKKYFSTLRKTDDTKYRHLTKDLKKKLTQSGTNGSKQKRLIKVDQ